MKFFFGSPGTVTKSYIPYIPYVCCLGCLGKMKENLAILYKALKFHKRGQNFLHARCYSIAWSFSSDFVKSEQSVKRQRLRGRKILSMFFVPFLALTVNYESAIAIQFSEICFGIRHRELLIKYPCFQE